jgi:hypothetical protein
MIISVFRFSIFHTGRKIERGQIGTGLTEIVGGFGFGLRFYLVVDEQSST